LQLIRLQTRLENPEHPHEAITVRSAAPNASKLASLPKPGPQKRELKRIQTRLLAKNRPPRSESPDASAPSLVRLPSPPKGSLFGLAPSTTEKFVRFSQPPPKGLYGSLSHHRKASPGLIISERLRPVSSSPKGFARSPHLRKASPGLHLLHQSFSIATSSPLCYFN
jgi:hypothetical protein